MDSSGWEYKKLGDIGTFIRGGNFSKKDFVEDGFPCIHYGQIHMKFGIETFKHISSVPAEMVKFDRCAHKGDLVIAITSEDDAGSCKCTAWMGDYDAYVGGHTAIYRHTMQPKYVSYYFNSPYFQKDKLEFTHGFKVVEINPKDIAKITIPVPPLSEQQSIVDYLDSAFAKIDAMKTNAEKSLNEAKALFQASLKEMLEPKEGWEEKKFGEACWYNKNNGIHKGTRYVGMEHIEQGTGVLLGTLSSDEVLSNTFAFSKGDVLYGRLRPYLKKVIVADFDGCCSTEIFPIQSKNIIGSFLMYWFLTDDITNKVNATCAGCRMPRGNMNDVLKFKISYPSLSEQQSIVATLDSLKSKVDTLQANYAKISLECDALKQAILRQVFE